MVPSEVAAIHYLVSENPSPSQFPIPIPIPTNLAMIENNIPPFQLSRFQTNLPNPHQLSPLPLPAHEFTPQTSCLSNNSTSDEAEENYQLISIIDERKKRRMISNRESARRSRMRKQKHFNELWSQVVRLRTENYNLVDKLNCVSESHDKLLQENARLKEEASDLRQLLTDHLQIIGSPYHALRDMDEDEEEEEVTCNTAHLRPESSNQSFITSTNLLH
ncbi:hypothetical protein U1Q18_002470 [Sarracenia purpurea var. burkii]